MERLERHLAGPAAVRVVVWREKHLFKAEVLATHRRRQWTALEERSDLEAAVAFALEKIDAQARKDTERRRDQKHRGGAGRRRKRPRPRARSAAAPESAAGRSRQKEGSSGPDGFRSSR